MRPKMHSGLILTYIIGCVIWMAALSSSITYAAGVWYVAPEGNDANNCMSPATACATINGALFKPSFAAGDVVRVATGTYTRDVGDEVVAGLEDAVLSGGWDDGFAAQTGVSVVDAQLADRRSIYVGGAGVVVTIERFLLTNSNGIHMGGGIYNDGVLTLSNSTVRGNTITVEGGGGIYNTGVLTVAHSSIENNAALRGGGIDNVGGTVVLIDSAVVKNTASASGGIHSTGVVTIESSTIAGNSSAGVYSSIGSLSIYNATIARNQVGVDGASGVTEIRNSIVAANTSADCSGTLTSLGYNLIQNAASCTFTAATGDQVGVDPRIGPQLVSAPAYYLLTADSPAVDAGNPVGCMGSTGLLLTDQRGADRVGRCDIGAIEAQALETSNKQVDRSNSSSGQLLNYAITLRNRADADVPEVVVTDTLPLSLTYQVGSLTAQSGSYGFSSGTITWTGTISAGATISITYRTLVAAGVPFNSTITNTAIISGDGLLFERAASFTVFHQVQLPLVSNNYCNDVFFDNFNDPASGWSIAENEFMKTEYVAGEYRMVSKQSGYLYLAKSPACDRANYVAEVDARWAGSSGDGYGLMFGRVNNYSEYYVFYVSADYGDFALFHRDSTGLHVIVPFTQSPAIHGGRATNHLKVIYSNGAMTFSVNDTTLGTWYGNVTAQSGTGVVTSPYDDRPASDARFDNFRVTRLLGAATTANGASSKRVMTTAGAEARTLITPAPLHIRLKGVYRH